MPLTNPDPLRYPGSAPTTGGTSTSRGASTADASAWVQQQPWYRSTLASWGNPRVLSLGQRGYLARTAQQAGMNPDFGIATDGSVEDWTGPIGAKIALAAFGAWAGGTALGLLPSGAGVAAAPSLAGPMAGAETGMAATTAALTPPASIAAGGSSVGVGGTLLGLGKKVAGDAASNAVNNVTGGGSSPGGGSKTAEAMALIGGLLAGQLLKNNGANNVPPQLSQLLDLGVQRTAYQQPLFQAVNQGVHSMLPTFARQGTQLSGTLSNAIPAEATPTSNGGMSGGQLASIIALATGGGVGLGGLMTGTNPYGAIADGIKKLFHGRGSSPSGGSGNPYAVVGPPDPDDPWNGDTSQYGGG